MFNFKRPKPTDTEEDLLAQQEEFRLSLDQKPTGRNSAFKPAAQVVKVKGNPEPSETENKRSTPNALEQSGTEQPDFQFMRGIKEKNVGTLKSAGPGVLSFEWMKPSEAENSDDENQKPKRISVFKKERMKQQEVAKNVENSTCKSDVWERVQANYEKFNPLKENKDLERKVAVAVSEECEEDPVASSVTSATTSNENEIGSKIHPLLAGYSEADILEAQRELLKIIKPETKEFILSRKQKMTEQTESGSPNNVQESAGDKTSEGTSDIKFEDLPIHPDSVKSIPHMDHVEKEKLEWTLPVETTKKTETSAPEQNSKETLTRSARFNFKGEIITEEMEKDEQTWNHALHNHGEEMDRPGYTIEELFTMARSTFAQQRALGFNTLAEIFSKSHNGEFDLCLDKTLFQACNEMDFIHVLRVGMDNTDVQSTNAAIHCLAALLYPVQEEFCLDCCYHWPDAEPYPCTTAMPSDQGNLEIPANPEEEIQEAEMKDYQHVRSDLIEFLTSRSDILVRFTYLLRNPEVLLIESGVLGILKILIRIARHSPKKLIDCDELLKLITKHFMTSNFTMIGKRPADMVGIPLPLALKLFRVLVNSSEKSAHKIYTELNLFPSVMSYLAYDQWLDQNHVMEVEFLILESFKLWDAFLVHGLGVQEYSSFFPIMMNFLHLLRARDTLCSFDLNHAAHLYALMEKMIHGNYHSHWNLVKEGASFVAAFVIKLLAILSRRNTAELYDHDLSLAAISKGLQFIALAQKYERFPGVGLAVKNFVESSGYSEITAALLSHSLLLCKLGDAAKELDKYPSNMSQCTSVLHGGSLTPIMDKKTPFSFLTSLLRFLNTNSELTEKLNTSVLDNNTEKYLKRISTSASRLRNNIFLRFELQCVSELLKFVPSTQQVAICHKILPQIQNGDQQLAEKFLSVFLKSSTYPSYAETFQLYSHFLIKPNQLEDSTIFQNLNMKLLPYDWIVEPLNHLHKRSVLLEKEKLDAAKRMEVLNSIKECTEMTLKFLEFCLNNHGAVIAKTGAHIAAIYSRVVLVFMMGNELFLERQIQAPLKNIAKSMLSNPALRNTKGEVFTNFNKIPGFSPVFSTFYEEILAEFGQNSFGDDVFATFIMLPLRTPEDRSVKSRFWNDESVRYIRMNLENTIVPLSYFTDVPELDPEILQVYRNTLSSPRVDSGRNPLLYEILKFHVNCK